MKKRNKIIIIVVSIILVLFTGVAYLIGDYFVNFSLVRGDDGYIGSKDDPNRPTDEDNPVVDHTIAVFKENYDKWIVDVDISDETIVSFDGLKLKALKYVTDPSSDKWVILVHGYTRDNKMMLERSYNFAQMGYNLLLPDSRAHGESEGKYVGSGWLERLDIIDWANTIIEDNSNAEIVLYGISMGGASVCMTSGELDKLPSNVKAIVSDCAYTTILEMFANQLDYRYGLPAFPILNFAHIVANFRVGYDLDDADVLAQVSKSKIPMLFIHGDIDNFVPVEMAYSLYEASNNPNSELLIIEGAYHAQADYVNPKLYYETIDDFLSKNVDNQ